MGPLLGACYRCTCLVHEADIIEGYAVLNDGRFECEQIHHADSCQEYARTHQEDIAAAAAAGRPIRKRARLRRPLPLPSLHCNNIRGGTVFCI